MYSFFQQGLIYPWDIKQFFNSAESDADIKEKLKSLGYVSSPPAPVKQPAKLPDPKSKIYIIKKLDYAQELLYKGIYNEAFAILEEVLKNDKENEVESLIHKALDFKINKFDVSYLKTGGCSVTMKKTSLTPNLSYDLYYKSFVNYIEKKCNT